ncbi:Snakin-2 [Asimina triloba]
MALFSKAAALALLFLSLLSCAQVQGLIASQEHDSPMAAGAVTTGLPKPIDCGWACGARCKLSKRPRLCKRACGTCCARCNCVPPGTSGNSDSCPCYAKMTTHGNKLKCP